LGLVAETRPFVRFWEIIHQEESVKVELFSLNL
jgi:hypothetical protein